ncbi:MAG: phosphohistidine phosphatase SixA [Gammaproteobacteria bacterium]|nr:phosphohistidine phosphatase SixA [Gammaproteobacteria bacterium]
MKLYLMRHGDAETNDVQRPLSERGMDEVTKIAEFLASNHIEVEQIYHSGKLRAEQTARGVAANFTIAPKIDILSGLLPDDSVKAVAVYCNHWEQDVMLVGHLPFMPRLVSDLITGADDKQCIDFKTAAIVCLERIAIFQWSISWFVYPHLLK